MKATGNGNGIGVFFALDQMNETLALEMKVVINQFGLRCQIMNLGVRIW